ncbi:MAG TPA: HDIG domain-containing protein [Thermomicrobiales bacterium]|nr:HDIG domain-containing protein [Thermomicrobiales bacterium]
MAQGEARRGAAATDGRWPTRDEAWALMTEYVQSQSLRRHMLAVEAAVRAYARRFGADEERWGVVALLHDFDYEIHPTLDHHPQDGAPILRERGYSEELIHDILTHADHLGLARETPLQKALYAVDEATGFAGAVALVRPDKRIASVTPQSFKKKMKDKAFARAVSREDMLHGAELLGVPFDEHIQVVVDAMTGIAGDLGLAGQEGA